MLERQLRDFHGYVLRVRKKTLSKYKRSTQSNKEHKLILEAIKDKDEDRAEKMANEHILNAYENMVKNGLYEAYGTKEEGQ